MTEKLREISVAGLAHIGDAVFELMVRTWLCTCGSSTAKTLHKQTVSFVSARAQSSAAEKILPHLSEDEAAVFKRGRNTQVNSIPKNATHEEYHAATGVETLFGYLYLGDQVERLNFLFELIVGE